MRAVSTLVLVLSLLAAAGPVAAQATHPSSEPASAGSVAEPTLRTPWSPHAFTFAAGTALTLGAGIRSMLVSTPPSDAVPPPVPAGVLFDEAFRTAVLVPVDDQERARRVSDVFLMATIVGVHAIDAVLAPLIQNDPDLAWQASFAHVLALSITLSLGDVVKRATERPRPFTRECLDEPDRPGCSDSDSRQSFYSLHTGMSFTSAGFSCAMHASRSLYNDPVADGAACGTAIAMAASTGLLRILADRHYLTDVLVGGAAGFLVGYLVPLFMVPERREVRPGVASGEPASTGTTWAVAPLLSPAPATARSGTSPLGFDAFGVSVFGAF